MLTAGAHCYSTCISQSSSRSATALSAVHSLLAVSRMASTISSMALPPAGEPERVGACLFPGLVKETAVDVTPMPQISIRHGLPGVQHVPTKKRETRTLVVRRAQVICECVRSLFWPTSERLGLRITELSLRLLLQMCARCAGRQPRPSRQRRLSRALALERVRLCNWVAAAPAVARALIASTCSHYVRYLFHGALIAHIPCRLTFGHSRATFAMIPSFPPDNRNLRRFATTLAEPSSKYELQNKEERPDVQPDDPVRAPVRPAPRGADQLASHRAPHTCSYSLC